MAEGAGRPWAEVLDPGESAPHTRYATLGFDAPPSLDKQANYTNALCMVGSFVYQTYEIDADALAMPTSPLDEILRLRAQCECGMPLPFLTHRLCKRCPVAHRSQAKQASLFSRRDANWIEWDDVRTALSLPCTRLCFRSPLPVFYRCRRHESRQNSCTARFRLRLQRPRRKR